METLQLIGEIAFAPGELAVCAVIALGVGLATGQFSRVWLAVIVALAADIAWPWVQITSNGAGAISAQDTLTEHLARDGGAAIILRMVLYFVAITIVLMFKRLLGTES